MNRYKTLVLAAAVAMPLPTASVAFADTAPAFGHSIFLAAADEGKSDTNMSDVDKRAKAADCSKKADEKKLHGEARKKFRAACKSGK